MNLSIREMQVTDLPAVFALNQAEVPRLGSLTEAALAQLFEDAVYAAVIEQDGAFVGFVLGLGPDARYESPNYRWFADRHERFLYVDRIAIALEARGRGIGRTLYEAVFAATARLELGVVCAEVNVWPRNPESLAFHDVLGFTEVGQQNDPRYGGDLRVAYFERPIP